MAGSLNAITHSPPHDPPGHCADYDIPSQIRRRSEAKRFALQFPTNFPTDCAPKGYIRGANLRYYYNRLQLHEQIAKCPRQLDSQRRNAQPRPMRPLTPAGKETCQADNRPTPARGDTQPVSVRMLHYIKIDFFGIMWVCLGQQSGIGFGERTMPGPVVPTGTQPATFPIVTMSERSTRGWKYPVAACRRDNVPLQSGLAALREHPAMRIPSHVINCGVAIESVWFDPVTCPAILLSTNS